MTTPQNGSSRPPAKKKVRHFAQVVDILRDRGAPEGFRRCRDILLERAEELVEQMPLYNVLKLAIEVDRHALFCEVAADKTRTAHDAEAYAAYQAYLAGTSNEPVAVGLPLNTKAVSAPAEADEEDDDVGQTTEEGGDDRPATPTSRDARSLGRPHESHRQWSLDRSRDEGSPGPDRRP